MNQCENAHLTLRDHSETEKFGLLLGMLVCAGDIICLDGDLGAGKTTLTQAIAKGLGVPTDPPVTSPSFTIFQEYQGRIPLYHFDLYRLHGPDDVLTLGLDEYFYLSGCTVIEWSERAEAILPAERLRLKLQVAGAETRDIFCHYHVKRWAARWQSLAKEFIASR